MTEFNGIGEQQGLGGVVHDMEAVVVVEDRADDESITGPKVPRLVRVGLVVGDFFSSKGGKWCGIVTVGGVQVISGVYGRI